ncbi:ACT protein, partial [Polyodon spathula]|nr:ACT protein [Polyodon spathula]
SFPDLPKDRVLCSGAVTFPGGFDQHGCPLLLFPVLEQNKLNSDLKKEDVVEFIGYFLYLHNKHQGGECPISVVLDLRQATLNTTRFITDTLLLAQQSRKTIHTVYAIQPKRRNVKNLLLKSIAWSSSKSHTASPMKCILLSDVFELFSYIDRSQLTADLGGYLVYSHRKWVLFIKEIDAFVREFFAVVDRLPSCIAHLQSLSQQPLPSAFEELKLFCSSNEAQYSALRRGLGLDDLLGRCDQIMEKLRCPEAHPPYRAMAGTSLFAHTAFEMLENHNRITAAVDKVELLWQQALSRAQLPLKNLQHRQEALQIIEHITTKGIEKLQSYRIEIAEDAGKAEILQSEYEAAIYKPGMELIRHAEDVLLSLSELRGVMERDGGEGAEEDCTEELYRVKENFRKAIELPHQTLKAVCDFYCFLNKVRHAHDECCLIITKLLTSSGSVSLNELHSALQWQEEFLRLPTWESPSHTLSNFILKGTIPSSLAATGKPPSLSSFDSGIDGAGSCHLDHRIVKEAWEMPNRAPVAQEIPRSAPQEPCVNEETIGSMSDSEECLEDLEFHSKRCRSSARIQIVPKIISGCLNFEVMVKRSASLPKNPWLSLPLEDLDNSYTVTITPTRPSVKCGLQSNLLRNPNALLETARLSEAKSHFLQVQRILENSSELSPIRNVMSSTLNDTRDKRSQSSWTDHTLLWDSYDLHASRKHHEGTRERMENYSAEMESLFNDWDLKEQEDLCVVEKLLVRAADILEEEESVLKQEEVLDHLVKIDSNKHFEIWSIDSDHNTNQMHVVPMSSSELVEAGVLGFEDSAGKSVSDEESGYCPTNSATAHDVHSAATIDFNKTTAASLNGSRAFSSPYSSSRLLQEMKELHVIEEQIFQENLKIHALQRFEEADGAAPEEQARGSLLNPSKERELFLRELEKERTEVERMEKSLARERAERNTKIRNKLHSGSRKAACSNHRQSSDPTARSRTKMRLAVTSALTNQKAAVNADKGTPLTIGHPTNQPKENFSKSDNDNSGEGISSPSNLQTTLSLAATTSIRNDGCPRTPEREAPFCLAEPSQTNRQLEGGSLIHAVATEGLQRRVLQSLDPSSRSCVPEESGGTTHSTPELLLTQPVHDIPGPVGDPFDSGETPAAVVAPIPKPRKASLPSNTDPKNQEERQVPTCKPVTMIASDPVSLKGCTFEPVVLEIQKPKHPPKPRERRRKNAVQQQKAGEGDSTLGSILSEKQPCCEADTSVTEIHRDDLTQPEAANNDRNSEAACSTPALKSDHGIDLQARQADCCDSEITKRSTSVEPDREGFCWDSVDAVEGLSMFNPDFLQFIFFLKASDYRTPIVLDTGSALMKAGFADQDLPTTIFPTVIGWPKYKEVMNGKFEREAYIGHDAQHMRGVLSLKYPMQHGIIQSWDEMEKIWHHTFHHQLCVDPEEHPVLLTEAVLNPQENRRRMVEILFETFHVPLAYVALQAVLALLATGRSTGVVFDSGDGLGHSVPVYEGYGLPHAIQRFHMAGQDVTQQLKKLLQERGFSFRTSAELEIVREVKEKCCYVSQDYEAELRGLRAPDTDTEMYYTLPDGQVINMGNERFRAPEILFKPELVGRDHYGMHESVFRSILRCDMDLRRTFMGNIILSGGNTMLSGLPLRLQEEIRSMVAVDLSDSVRVTSPKDRDFSVWRGGAVLTSLPSFSAAWISQGEYEEFGPDIVFRKCF